MVYHVRMTNPDTTLPADEELGEVEIAKIDVTSTVAALESSLEHLDEIIDSARQERNQLNAYAKEQIREVTARAAERRTELNKTIAEALEQRKTINRIVSAARGRKTKPKAKAAK